MRLTIFVIMVSRHIIKGNVKGIQQVFEIIGREIAACEDQVDSTAFFSEYAPSEISTPSKMFGISIPK